MPRKDAELQGDVAGHDDIKLEERVRLGGDAMVAGKVSLGSGKTVDGAIANGADLPAVTQLAASADAGGSRAWVKKARTGRRAAQGCRGWRVGQDFSTRGNQRHHWTWFVVQAE